ncbi:MAG: hypothetical protein DRH56_04650 [Deltaproteobacteria bacterium]|nr:MAG: hypothetical protein DRH56_04650 [Deltaproteobacteria bacterium]
MTAIVKITALSLIAASAFTDAESRLRSKAIFVVVIFSTLMVQLIYGPAARDTPCDGCIKTYRTMKDKSFRS